VQGVALTQCADTAVPHLRELKSGCASEIAAYRTCLERNEQGSDAELGEKCGGLMKTVWECSERVMTGLGLWAGGICGRRKCGWAISVMDRLVPSTR
jgi:hypothetical protein